MDTTQNLADMQAKITSVYTKSVDRATRRDPQPGERRYAYVSVDDHLCEPPNTFTGRLPAKFAEATPRVERGEDCDWWIVDDERIPVSARDGVQTWVNTDWDLGNVHFDDYRPGIWDIHARIRDMDLVGMYASLNFPSMWIGFCGQRFMRVRDSEYGLALMRAYNSWMIEEWSGPYPDRIIPSQVTWLLDPVIAAAEIRRNAERGFKAVSFSENPEKLGLPSIHSGYWDPFLAACAETGTVVNLHVGSSSYFVVPSSDSPIGAANAIGMINAMMACADWLFSHIPARYPDIRIVLSEGGIDWVPTIQDRLRYQAEHFLAPEANRQGMHATPAEIAESLARTFYYASFYDPSGLVLRHQIGLDHIMIETDYPHGDSPWPECQALYHELYGGLPEEERRKILYENACALYRHPLPPDDFLVRTAT